MTVTAPSPTTSTPTAVPDCILVERWRITKILTAAQLRPKNLNECETNSAKIRELAESILSKSPSSPAEAAPGSGASALARAKAARVSPQAPLSGDQFVAAVDRAIELSARAQPNAALAGLLQAHSACNTATISSQAMTLHCYVGSVLRQAGPSPSPRAAAAALNSIRVGRVSVLGTRKS